LQPGPLTISIRVSAGHEITAASPALVVAGVTASLTTPF
jgi:hypothetical protein